MIRKLWVLFVAAIVFHAHSVEAKERIIIEGDKITIIGDLSEEEKQTSEADRMERFQKGAALAEVHRQSQRNNEKNIPEQEMQDVVKESKRYSPTERYKSSNQFIRTMSS